MSDLMSGEPVAYEKETFGSSPEVIKGGRRRKSRGKKSGKKSRKSRRIRRKTRGGAGNAMEKPTTMGAGDTPVSYGGGKRRSRRSGKKRRKGGSVMNALNSFKPKK